MVGSPFDDDDDREPPGGVLPELTKRILSAGVGAYFLTEDAVRRAVGEAKLPSDVADRLVTGAKRRKDDMLGFVKRELAGVIQNIDVQGEVRRFLSAHKVKISAEIEFIPKERPTPIVPTSDAGDGPPGSTSDDHAEPPFEGPDVELDVRVKPISDDELPPPP